MTPRLLGLLHLLFIEYRVCFLHLSWTVGSETQKEHTCSSRSVVGDPDKQGMQAMSVPRHVQCLLPLGSLVSHHRPPGLPGSVVSLLLGSLNLLPHNRQAWGWGRHGRLGSRQQAWQEGRQAGGSGRHAGRQAGSAGVCKPSLSGRRAKATCGTTIMPYYDLVFGGNFFKSMLSIHHAPTKQRRSRQRLPVRSVCVGQGGHPMEG